MRAGTDTMVVVCRARDPEAEFLTWRARALADIGVEARVPVWLGCGAPQYVPWTRSRSPEIGRVAM